MKKVLSVLKLFCTLLVISVGFNLFELVYKVMHYFMYGIKKPRVFGVEVPEDLNEVVYYILFFSSLSLLFYLLYLMIEFRKVIFNFAKEDVFTKENSSRLRKVGFGLIVYGFVVVLFDLVLGVTVYSYLDEVVSTLSRHSYHESYKLGRVIGTIISRRLPIFLVALFVQFISFIVIKGNELQEENDLTI